MALPQAQTLEVRKGSTFVRKVFWETDTVVYRPITNITKAAPASITCPLHAIPAGWRATIVSVKGMGEINCTNTPPKDADWHTVTVVDPNTIELNGVNASEFTTYLSGGYLRYQAPKDLAGYTARMAVKDKAEGTLYMTLTTENGGLEVNNTTKCITITISAALAEGMTWKRGAYDLELVSATGVVTSILAGTVRVSAEVTT